MTVNELKTKLETTLARLSCLKNEYLCYGKCVIDINNKLMKAYNWWWLLYQGETLTDKEIQCVNNNIPSIPVQVTIPVNLTDDGEHPLDDNPDEIPEDLPVLNAKITFFRNTKNPTDDTGTNNAACVTNCNGITQFKYEASGGVPPYSYEFRPKYREIDCCDGNWSTDDCPDLKVINNSDCLEGVEFNTFVSQLDNSTQIVEAIGVNRAGICVLMIVTDSAGQQVQKEACNRYVISRS